MQGKVSVVAGCPFLFIEALQSLHSITKVVLSLMAPAPPPHEYGPGSLKNEIQVNAIR